MTLKRLELRGFKTFAQSTEFVFPNGVTAVVGPNGSGKSNIADSIRWVLGEQSLRAVRGKRTEDVIFAGTTARAQAGMAEVSITFDNASGRFPVSLSEVKITRRAYRSGENEYLLNGRKTRLRELSELLLKVGVGDSAFVVIGQGMVDLALSLRADERRALIEEAADVKRFYVKLDETREKLATTEQALSRARDLVADIAPRMAGLAAQAERLREHQTLSGEMQGLLRQWHRHVRDQLALALEAADKRIADVEREVEGLKASLERHISRSHAIQDDELAGQQRIAGWQREAAGFARELETLRREVAVLAERAESHGKLETDIQGEVAQLRKAHKKEQCDLTDLQLGAATTEAEVAALGAALADCEARFAAQARLDGDVAAKLAHAREEAVRLRERGAGLIERRRLLASERGELVADVGQKRASLAGRQAVVERVAARAATEQSTVDKLAADGATLSEEIAKASREAAAADDGLQHLAAQARVLDRDLGQERARLEVIERWRDSHSAYASGVRAVLNAATAKNDKAPQLRGIIGVAADLLRVPQLLETAIEVALGGRAQEIVVEKWGDAEAAINLLKQNGAGRATFLPLDTLRMPATGNPLALNEPGVRGVAATLVGYDPVYHSVVAQLLGRTLVVDDLFTARRVLDLCPSGWQIVTLDGEIVRTSGAVTGGARKGSEVGLLARQRELSQLRERVAALERQAAEAGTRLASERAAQAARRRHLSGLDLRRRELDGGLRQAAAKLGETNAELRGLGDEQRRVAEEVAAKTATLTRTDSRLVAMDEEIATIQAQAAASVAAAGVLAKQQEAVEKSNQGAVSAIGEQRTQLAVKTRELAGQRALIATRQRDVQDLAARIDDKAARLSALAESVASVAAERQSLAARLAVAEGELARRECLIEPEQRRLAGLAAARREVEESVVVCREQLAVAEATRRETGGEVGRVRERVIQAQELAESELGRAVADEIWFGDNETSSNWPLQIEEAKRRLDKVRAQLRAIGMVNPLAIVEHEEAAARHDFLTREVHDAEEAAKALRGLSLHLRQTMQKRFEQTFAAVATHFRQYFTRLFGGGTARLVLTQPDDLSQAGVDIIAQPPGRRLQNLGLLSGGERALTAAALLFAVLAVKPIPFCILDEVDAALDEANVGRFCQALRELAAETQFIVITHNRNTMEIADALYGISMPADSVSQVISLRAPDQPREDLEDVWQVATP